VHKKVFLEIICPHCVCSERPPCQSNRMNRVKLGFREGTLFVKLTFSENLSFSTQLGSSTSKPTREMSK
jgi:hypothetical protein